MKLALATLALLLASAAGLNAKLERAAGERRVASARIDPFLDPERARGARVAALTVRGPGGDPEFVYARLGGRWRCASAFQAPCDDAAIERLVVGLLEARGVVRSRDPAALEAYGLGDDALRLTLHGAAVFDRPDRDVLFDVRVGRSSGLAGSSRTGWSFAALGDQARVHELDLDLRAGIEDELRQGFPPLLELRLVPRGWLQQGAHIERLIFEPLDAAPYELIRREREPGEELGPDELPVPWEWLAVGPSGSERAPTQRAEAICAFLQAAPYRGLEDPRRAAELGLSRPGLRITVVPSRGDPLVLHVGDAAPAGGVWVLNRTAGLLCSVDDAVAALLAPSHAALVEPPPANPWDRWLRRR